MNKTLWYTATGLGTAIAVQFISTSIWPVQKLNAESVSIAPPTIDLPQDTSLVVDLPQDTSLVADLPQDSSMVVDLPRDTSLVVDLPQDSSLVVSSGVQLWAQNCNRCHNMLTPSSHHLDMTMLHMRIQASLTAKEYETILGFLKAAN